MRIVSLALCFLSAAAAVPAQQNPISRGRNVPALYAQYCAGCHGAELQGGSGPSLVEGRWRHGTSDADLTSAIRKGFPQGGMPALADQFNAAEIRGLVVYLREQSVHFQQAHGQFNAPKPGETARGENATFKLEPLLEEGLKEPWALAVLPDGRLLVTERAGRLRLVENGKLLPEPVSGTPAVFGGEGGLLDVVLHSRYSQPGQDWIYLSYGDKSPGGLAMIAVVRGRLRNGAFVDQQPIFKADYAQYRPGGLRFGSRLLFDRQGHLYFSIGDRGSPGDEQDLTQPNGKVHRVNDDGSIPPDNPFVGRAGAVASIWTFGHRNPQGLAFHPQSGKLWETEHGPRGGDEVNILQPAHNYGWPNITYGINYDGMPITDHVAQDGIDQPITTWVPSIAVSPIAFYGGNEFPQWKNNLLVGSLAAQELLRLTVSGDTVTHQEILFKGVGRVRDLVAGPDGELYLVLNQPDRIMRLVPGDGLRSQAVRRR